MKEVVQVADMITFTARVDRSTWKRFTMISTAQDTTPTELIRGWIDQYIEEHREAAREALEE